MEIAYVAAFGAVFGLWLVPLGYLAYRSGMFPRGAGRGPRRRGVTLPSCPSAVPAGPSHPVALKLDGRAVAAFIA